MIVQKWRLKEMKTTTNKALYFIMGTVTGIIGTYVVLKPRYDKMYGEAVESAVEARCRKYDEDKNACVQRESVDSSTNPVKPYIAPKAETPKEQVRINYSQMIEKTGYAEESEKEDKDNDKPYIISPEEYEDNVEYNVYYMKYMADGVLVDDLYDPVDNVEDLVGVDFPEHFGEYEEDTVYIRDDIKGCDYQINLDLRTYEEVRKDKAPQMEE